MKLKITWDEFVAAAIKTLQVEGPPEFFQHNSYESDSECYNFPPAYVEIQKQEGECKDLISIANKLMATPDWRSADLYHALLEAFRLGEAFNAREKEPKS